VNDALRDCPGVVDATTYGVVVPGTDGRAGMAAIVVDGRFDFEDFARHLARRLPTYAHPVFIRISATLDATETFKQKKQQLVREGFDPRTLDDRLLFRDPAFGAYQPLDADIYARVVDGAIRL
jgi:fatty-acyl-CoA synthase